MKLSEKVQTLKEFGTENEAKEMLIRLQTTHYRPGTRIIVAKIPISKNVNTSDKSSKEYKLVRAACLAMLEELLVKACADVGPNTSTQDIKKKGLKNLLKQWRK